MIDQLELQNFQSHKDTTLEFEPGVNVIIGPSDSGKTSIIRILRWIAWNRPLGDAFRSNWGGDTVGRLILEDCVVERLEGDRDRHYRLYDPFNPNESDELVFEAFGTDVPEEIQAALNLSEINLQEQMDSPFLISENSGQVSRHFNKVANIDAIDTSLRNIESWIRSVNNDKKAAQKEIERHEENLEDFEHLDKLEAEVEVLEQFESQKNSITNQCNQIYDLVYKIEDVSEEIKEKSDLLPAYSWVVAILNMMKQTSSEIGQFKELKHLIFSIVDTREELEEAQKITQVEAPVQKILELYDQEKELQNEIDNLLLDIGGIEKTVDYIKRDHDKLARLEEKWHENMPEVCPLCGK